MSNYKILATIELDEFYPTGELTVLGTSKLKRKLESLRKDKFENDERIRVIYSRDKTNWQIMCATQRVINDVDISNYFILISTGYQKINEVISIVSKNISRDKVSMQYEIVDKEFHLVTTTHRKNPEYNDIEPLKISYDELTKREKFLLTKSNTFCIYPWIHLHAYPTGDAYPCCQAEHSNGPLGNCQQQSLKDIWSGDKMKQLRDDMLNERENSACVRCYEQEKSGFFSGRKSANKHHGHNIKKGVELDPPFELSYWDIRFSNLCNLSCRSCGHIFSSSWHQDQKKLAGPEWAKNNKALFWAGRHETDMLEQLMEHIPYVEQIYFAGGEPLMMDEHYAILEELEQREMFNVKLVYNTNFTKMKLKDRYVFDYWRRFQSVAVGASLDAMGPRAEYIRKGTEWAEIERNREMMLVQCPNVDFYISPTLSIQNALHIPDFHKDWVKKGLIKPQDLNINILQDPAWLRIDIAPEHYKEKIRAKYQEHLEWLRPLDKLNRATVGFESALRFLDSDNVEQLPIFWKNMKKLDELRKENLLEVIPELNEIRIDN
jgi:radical SAM protein with 4Fe4S-binding SPASM domain